MSKRYYNGVLLPEIPAEVLAVYPYAWIRDNGGTGYFDLVVAPDIWYYTSGGMNKSVSSTCPYYSIPKDSYLTYDAWEYNKDASATLFTLDASRTVLWSGFDVPNGSAAAVDIYHYKTEPIPEESSDLVLEYIQSTGLQYFDTGIIPDANTEVEIQYSVQKILDYGAHVLSCAYWYTPFPRGFSNGFFTSRMGAEAEITALTPAINTKYMVKAFPGDQVIINGTAHATLTAGSKVPTKTLYMCTYGGSPGSTLYTGTTRVYYCKIWQGGTLVRDYIPAWRAGAVGMYDRVNEVFSTSEGTAEFYAGPALYGLYDRKYLVRSNSTLYTVTDGTLTALAETNLSALLFQTYGVDDLPDGSLLAGLTEPEVLYWHDSDDDLPDLTATVTGSPPAPQIVTSGPQDLTHASITGISHAVVTASTDVLFALSFDAGATWLAHNGTAWYTVDDESPGMAAETFNAITAEQWAEVVELESYMVRFWLPNTTAFVTSVVINYLN